MSLIIANGKDLASLDKAAVKVITNIREASAYLKENFFDRLPHILNEEKAVAVNNLLNLFGTGRNDAILKAAVRLYAIKVGPFTSAGKDSPGLLRFSRKRLAEQAEKFGVTGMPEREDEALPDDFLKGMIVGYNAIKLATGSFIDELPEDLKANNRKPRKKVEDMTADEKAKKLADVAANLGLSSAIRPVNGEVEQTNTQSAPVEVKLPEDDEFIAACRTLSEPQRNAVWGLLKGFGIKRAA